MGRNKIILVIGVIFLAGVGAFFVTGMRTPAGIPSTHPQTTAFSTSQVTYDASGKIDTRDWQEYRSEYGGFSVRAPKKMSMIGCFGHPCDPRVSGERFFYVLFQTYINEEVGEVGLSIKSIKKINGSTLDTWLSDYIISGRDQFFDMQKVSVNGYPALRLDWRKEPSEQKTIYVRSGIYPDGNTYTYILVDPTVAASKGVSSRFLVIDLGDRYAFVFHTLSIDREALSKSYVDYPDYQKQALTIPSNKTLADIYAAILDSFQAFTPTKP